MNKILEWFTLNKILISGLISLPFFFILSSRNFVYDTCLTQQSVCYHFLGYLLLISLFFTTILIPVFILFLLKKEVFYFWRKTLVIYLVIYLFIILIIPWRGGDVYLRIEKDMFALYFSILYFIYSIFFIIYHSLKKT